MSDDGDHVTRESADKIRLKTQVKRGEGTRDQDTIDVKVRGDDPDETVAKLHQTLAALERHGVADHIRGVQPEADDGE